MGVAPRRKDLARPAAVALLLTALTLVPAATARAAWSAPFRVAGPSSLDVIAPAAAVSKDGAAIGFGLQSPDDPAFSGAFLVRRGGHGGDSRPAPVPGAQQILDLTYFDSTPELLIGGSPSGLECCSQAEMIDARSGGRFGRAQTVIRGLAGATVGRLVAIGGKILAAVATSRGVWVAQSNAAGRLGPTHRLGGPGDSPQALAAAAKPGGGAIVGWSAAGRGREDAQRIFTAGGSDHAAPAHRRLAITVAGGHAVDELGLAASTRAVTVAWIESWYDRRGGYHSQPQASDLIRHSGTRGFAVPKTVAAGLSLAGTANGTQVLAWKTCTWTGTCSVQVAVRRPGRTFSRPMRVGGIDAEEVPALAIDPAGAAIVGWVSFGHVVAAALSPGADRFSGDRLVSGTSYADNLTLAYGAAGQAIAVWSQGTFQTEVVAATYE